MARSSSKNFVTTLLLKLMLPQLFPNEFFTSKLAVTGGDVNSLSLLNSRKVVPVEINKMN